MKKIIITALYILIANISFGQANTLQGSNEVYVYVSDEPVGANFKNSNYDYVKISSNINGKWNDLATVQGAKNENEFKKNLGDNPLKEIATAKKLKTESAAWEFVLQSKKITDYGIFTLNPSLAENLGAMYIHKINAKNYVSKSYSYKIEYYKNNNKVKEQTVQQNIIDKLPTTSPSLLNKLENDSTVSASWFAKSSNMKEVIFANIYKADAKDNFSFFKKVFAVGNNKNDSIIISITDYVEPGGFYKYLAVPCNFAGLEGTASDTANLFSINFKYTAQAQNLKAIDTINGIYLTFDPPATTPIITGIVLERSRYDKTGYAQIDTLSPNSNFYLDKNVLPDVQYYYQLRTINIRQSATLPTAWAGATHSNKREGKPLPPAAVTALATKNGVVISWKALAQIDIAGFKVYRANTANDKLQEASYIVKDDSFLDTMAKDNRRQFVYTVTSISFGGVESAMSDKVFASPINNNIIPLTPTGFAAAPELGRVILKWKNSMLNDPFIKGYKLYRKALEAKEKVKDKEWKANELLQNGFNLINTDIIKTTSYQDVTIANAEQYAYYITAVDDKNMESNAANIVVVEMPKIKLMPPGNFAVRKVTAGVTISWDKSQQAGATGYIIYKREANSIKAEQLTKLPATANTFTDKAVQKNKTYYYTIATTGSTTNIGNAGLEKGVFIN